MAKGLEVVETGMTLSVRLLNRLNAAIQLQGGEGADAPAWPYPGARPAPGEGQATGAAPFYRREPEASRAA